MQYRTEKNPVDFIVELPSELLPRIYSFTDLSTQLEHRTVNKYVKQALHPILPIFTVLEIQECCGDVKTKLGAVIRVQAQNELTSKLVIQYETALITLRSSCPGGYTYRFTTKQLVNKKMGKENIIQLPTSPTSSIVDFVDALNKGHCDQLSVLRFKYKRFSSAPIVALCKAFKKKCFPNLRCVRFGQGETFPSNAPIRTQPSSGRTLVKSRSIVDTFCETILNSKRLQIFLKPRIDASIPKLAMWLELFITKPYFRIE